MASLESYGVDEYGNSNGVNLPDFTGCLLLATTPTPPAGTLVADGSEVSREAYAKLFAIFGTQYGSGDGVSTFALPDWRDEFPRFSGASRAVLTAQEDAIRNITGEVNFTSTVGSGTIIYGPHVDIYSAEGGAFDAINDGSYAYITAGDGKGKRGLRLDASRVVPTADENRPRNVAFLPCIIYV